MRGQPYTLRRLISEEDGQDIIEYGLLAAFISIVVYLFLLSTGLHVTQMYTAIGTSTSTAASASS